MVQTGYGVELVRVGEVVERGVCGLAGKACGTGCPVVNGAVGNGG